VGLCLLVVGWNAAPSCAFVTNPENFIQHDKMFQIWYENAIWSDVLADPVFYGLSKQGQYLANFFAITHPSQPNYLAAVAGDTEGITGDGPILVDGIELVDLLEAKGISWKIYAEDYPGNCYTGEYSPQGAYVAKHNPFISFKDIIDNPARCAKIVNSDQLAIDVAADNLAQYSWYIPNTLNDGHDTNISYAGMWTQGFLPPLLSNPSFMKGMLVVLTYDEAEYVNGSNGLTNQIYTVLLGGPGVPVTVGLSDYTLYSHYSLLKTSLVNWNLGSLRRYDQIATPFLRYAPLCGDGVATGNEQCDLGNLAGPKAWLSFCCNIETCQFLRVGTSCGRNTAFVGNGCIERNLMCGTDTSCDETFKDAGAQCRLPGGILGTCSGANATCTPVSHH